MCMCITTCMLEAAWLLSEEEIQLKLSATSCGFFKSFFAHLSLFHDPCQCGQDKIRYSPSMPDLYNFTASLK